MFNIYAPAECARHLPFPFTLEKPIRTTGLAKTFLKFKENFEQESVRIITNIRPATDEQLLRVHSRTYLENLASRGKHGLLISTALNLIEGDVQWYTRVSRGTYQAARYAAGAVIEAVDDIFTRDGRAFCSVRPPGHHAGPAHGEGFCMINNVAVGAAHAASKGLRVAVVDFDRHHGNGTEQIVRDKRLGQIFFASSYQEGCKYAPAQPVAGDNILHVPIPKGSTSRAIKALYNEKVAAGLKAFAPNLLIISAGFDMHESDPLSSVRLKSADYFDLTKILTKAANCPVVSVLEGGYNEKALNQCVGFHLAGLSR